ncbi:MAG: 4Fe-4S dicluster domain-containing protein [Chloroflexi bacterium]|nr:4Fe-4S dicluster domain-containing protein [Chloroflexota bacterium]MBM3153948.1 4Fe-4S dicluster domain-containing protein [Chloroflexota bacterium]MBM3172298.1 4Fe-4S dicluster domain-containing protein [Chloroflexota bacterium]MBM3174768.1 4Fe-4S dicluster domain-containing protein [Chloroflexota bacterium]MBM4450113.1 4Fe-4S dicluster domain-containing protein [Chloroflexota bacterium]
MTVSKRIVLHFPPRLVDKAIVSKLVKDYGLDFNIIKASVTPGEEGLLVMELTGEQRNYDKGLKYLTDTGVKIQSLSQDVVRNEARCTHCGACITMCPSGAFSLETGTRKVLFENSKCVVCELCIKACPPRAMELYF